MRYVAAAVALLVSFGVLGLAWRESRFRGDDSGRPMWPWLARIVESRVTHAIVVVIALTFTAWIVMAAVFGRDIWSTRRSVSCSCCCGSGWCRLRSCSDRSTDCATRCAGCIAVSAAAAGTDYRRGLQDYPARLGLWPASFFLFAFVWLELVDPSIASSLSAVRLWFLVLAALLMVGAAVFGDTLFARSDPFEVYSGLVARL